MEVEGADRQMQLLNARVAENLDIEDRRRKSRMVTLAKRVTQRRANQWMRKRRAPGGCTAKTERCPEAPPQLLDTPECCKAHIRRIMADVAAMLDGAGIRWWIDYGTLLGWTRHKGLIPWDKDCDLGILGDDRAKLLNLQAEFLGMGYHAVFKPIRPTERFRSGDRMKVRLSQKNHTNVDIFIWYKRPGKILDRKNYIGADLYKGREFPMNWALPLTRGKWDGIDVNIPAEPEKLAEHRYGASWQTPLREKHPAEVRE